MVFLNKFKPFKVVFWWRDSAIYMVPNTFNWF
jgi:hypothetical protein